MSDTPPRYHDSPSNIPIPDPSLITAQEINRSKAELRLEVATSINAVRELFAVRFEVVEQHILAVEDKVIGRVVALKELVDLSTEMSKEAITKAEIASEKRFEGLNELRGAMSDQATSYLPRIEAEARFNSHYDKIDQIAAAVAANQLDMKSMMRRDDLKPLQDDITKLRDVAAISGGKEKVWAIVGTGGLAICAVIVALFAAFHTAPDRSPPLSADTNRINDLVTQFNANIASQDARMTALSNRMNQLTPPLVAPPQK